MSEKLKPLEHTALVLCGGLGTRLQERTQNLIPKSLVPINGVPIIEHSLKPFYESRVDQVVLLVAHFGDQIINYFSEHSTLDEATRIYFSNRERLEGIVPAVKKALLEGFTKGSISISDGDTLRLGLDVSEADRFHKSNEATTTLVATDTLPPDAYSLHGVRVDESGNVIEILRPPRPIDSDILTMSGMIIISQGVSDLIKTTQREKNWEDLIQLFESTGNIRAYRGNFIYRNLNTPEAIDEAERLIKNEN